MSIRGLLGGRFRRATRAWQKRSVLKKLGPWEITPADWPRSLRHPTEFYLDCFRFYHQRLPASLREHRAYFANRRGGFHNEEAMYPMWFVLFAEFKPGSFLEIGVFRGQTISLAATLARLNRAACTVQGISPFDGAGDPVPKHPPGFDYLQDTPAHFRHFGLEKPDLLRARSTAPEAAALIRSIPWDMIYIDGNHDYEVAQQDWEICSQSVTRGGIIVLNNSGVDTAYQPPPFAAAGHPGPSRLAKEIDRSRFHEILQVGHSRVFQKVTDE